MHGPPRTTQEIVVTLRRRVTSLIALGLPTPAAIRAAAMEFGADPGKVAVILDEPVDVSVENAARLCLKAEGCEKT